MIFCMVCCQLLLYSVHIGPVFSARQYGWEQKREREKQKKWSFVHIFASVRQTSNNQTRWD